MSDETPNVKPPTVNEFAANAVKSAPPSAPSTQKTSRISLSEWADEESSTRTTDATIAVSSPVPHRHKTGALLTVVVGPHAGRAYSIVEPITLVGRGKTAHVRIDDPGASRSHARIVVSDDGKYVLEDLGSTNGTFVDGVRVERVELKSGDRIRFGASVTLSFAILDAQAERLQHQLYESSVRDPLTRAHNRRYLVERLAGEIAYAKRHASEFALMLLDLDHFKRINDTHGHLAGDDVLRGVASLISRMIRAEDVLARFGGEEFVVAVRGIELGHVLRFAERLRAAIERQDIKADTLTLRVTASIGCASLIELPESSRDADGLLRLADERLYAAKTQGRNRVCAS
ncbi:MAG: GGDEF domain-containing protein [Polyangiaceae bacterium]|jgi:diguanylate cyclase (GGDEF)-like protein